MRRIDLHIHTTASDGTDSPAEAVERAARLGLAAVSVTDHDTAAGTAEAMAAGARLGVEVVSGIEVSTDYRDNNIHILGYFIDPGAPALRQVLDWVEIERRERNEKMAEILSAAGFDISIEAVRAEYPDAVIGRPHFAEFLMKRGYVSSVAEGFDRYLEVGRPFFLPKRRISVARAIETIRASGGVAVLAHPLEYHYPVSQVLELIEYARDLGVQALECYYSEHSPAEQDWLLARAAEYGLGVSGGSDYHGTRKPWIEMGSGMGGMSVPWGVLDALRALKA